MRTSCTVVGELADRCLLQCVLHYMVGSKDGVGGVSGDVGEILLSSGLMKKG